MDLPLSRSISRAAARVLQRASNVATSASRLDQPAIDSKGATSVLQSGSALGGGAFFLQFDSGQFNEMVLGGVQRTMAGKLDQVVAFADRRLPASEAGRLHTIHGQVHGAPITDPAVATPLYDSAGVQLQHLAAQADVLRRGGSLELTATGIAADVDAARLTAAAGDVGLEAGVENADILRRLLADASSAVAHTRPGLIDGMRGARDPYGISVAASKPLRQSEALATARGALDALRGVVLDGSASAQHIDAAHEGVQTLGRRLAMDGISPTTGEVRALAAGVDRLWQDTSMPSSASHAAADAVATTPAALHTASDPVAIEASWKQVGTMVDAAIDSISSGADPALRKGVTTLSVDGLRDVARQVESMRDSARVRRSSMAASMLDGVLNRLYPQIVRAQEWKPGVIHEGRTPQHAELGRVRSDLATARMVDDLHQQELAGTPESI